MTETSTFRLDHVSVHYSTAKALTDVTLEIKAGEVLALVGPSGAGKTTLLGCLNGMVRATEGSVEVLGECLRELKPRQLRSIRRQIGYVPQQLGLVLNLRVIHNVLAGRLGDCSLPRSLRLMFWPSKADTREVYDLLERVGIGDKLYERTDRLAGGQQQRVSIARALFQRSQAILADEPVSSVDPARARDTIRLLVELANEAGLTLCVSLHNLELAREFFPRLIGLRDGRIVFDRKTEQLDDEAFHQLYDLSDSEMLASSPGPAP